MLDVLVALLCVALVGVIVGYLTGFGRAMRYAVSKLENRFLGRYSGGVTNDFSAGYKKAIDDLRRVD